MSSRRVFQGVLASLAASAVLTTVIAARAEATITPTVTGIVRTVPRRSNTLTTLWISRSDCLADDVLTFPLITANVVGQIEVWVSNGADCRPAEARNSTNAQCWKVFSAPATAATVLSVPIKVRDIAAKKKPPTFTESVGDITSCTPDSAASAAEPITLYFMSILGDLNQGGSAWATKLDLVGPAPPTAPPVGTNPLAVGNTLLIPSWSPTGDIDVAGYDFFCAPVDATTGTPVTMFGAGTVEAGGGGSSAAADAGAATCSDASSDAADDVAVSDATNDQVCTTAPASPGTSASTDAATAASCGSAFVIGSPPTEANLRNSLCGSVATIQATTVTLTGLTNGTTYEVAIGAVDAVGNVGPLSTPNCAMPQPTIGFPERVEEAGGNTGNGFCSMGRAVPGPTGWRWFAASLLGVGMGLGRRKRRSAPS